MIKLILPIALVLSSCSSPEKLSISSTRFQFETTDKIEIGSYRKQLDNIYGKGKPFIGNYNHPPARIPGSIPLAQHQMLIYTFGFDGKENITYSINLEGGGELFTLSSSKDDLKDILIDKKDMDSLEDKLNRLKKGSPKRIFSTFLIR